MRPRAGAGKPEAEKTIKNSVDTPTATRAHKTELQIRFRAVKKEPWGGGEAGSYNLETLQQIMLNVSSFKKQNHMTREGAGKCEHTWGERSPCKWCRGARCWVWS